MRPHRQQPTRLRRPWDSPGKNTGVGCHFLLQCMKVKSESEVAQSCPTLRDPMDCSLPGSSVHGIFQARRFHTYVLKCKKYWKHAAMQFGTPELKSSLQFPNHKIMFNMFEFYGSLRSKGFLHALRSVSVCFHSHFLKTVWICNLLAFLSLYYILHELQNALNWYF